MAKITGSVYLNTQNFDKSYERLIQKKKDLEKKITLNADDTNLKKTIEYTEKIVALNKEKAALEQKKISGSATQAELNQLSSIHRSLGQNISQQNKYLQLIEKTSPMYAGMVKSLTDILNVNMKINQQSEMEVRYRKDEEAAIKKQIAAEKELLQIKNEQQSLLRQMYDQEHSVRTGKRQKTPLDDIYFKEQYNANNQRASELMKQLGGNSKAVQQYLNGIAFTERNNPLRILRDEGQQLAKEIPKWAEQLEKLSAAPEKHISQIERLNQKLSTAEAKIEEIKTKFAEAIAFEQENNMQGGLLSQEDYDWAREQIPNLEKIISLKRQDLIETQKAISEDKQLVELSKRRLEVEEQIRKLSTNEKGKISEVTKNQHKNELKILESEKNVLDKQIDALAKKNNLSKDIVKKIKEGSNAEDNARRITEAHNRDLQNQGRLLSDTIKNFAKFTIYYQSLRLLRQGIQEALETMKELDKAMTDVRLVTGDTKEGTAALAMEYNQLAKEMGSTTTAVAEGAGEWFNESRDH